jgi:hypothetical protein
VIGPVLRPTTRPFEHTQRMTACVHMIAQRLATAIMTPLLAEARAVFGDEEYPSACEAVLSKALIQTMRLVKIVTGADHRLEVRDKNDSTGQIDSTVHTFSKLKYNFECETDGWKVTVPRDTIPKIKTKDSRSVKCSDDCDPSPRGRDRITRSSNPNVYSTRFRGSRSMIVSIAAGIGITKLETAAPQMRGLSA